MSKAIVRTRPVPKKILALPLGARVKWARETAGLSHDRLVTRLGRSNRGHLIKIEQGLHTPRADLRDAIADATGVPRELFADDEDEESDPAMRQTFDMFVALMDRISARTSLRHENHDPNPLRLPAAGSGSQTEGA